MNTVPKVADSCAFCGTKADQKPLIRGMNASICSECAKTCYQMFEERSLNVNEDVLKNSPFHLRYETEVNDLVNPHVQYKQDKNSFIIPSPSKIKSDLDRYVVGQDQAKIALSVAVYNHYRRIFYKDVSKIKKSEKIDIQKSNMLLIGPSGSGKTLLIKTLAKTFNLPLAIADATTLTESGYVGDDVESVLQRLLDNAEGDVACAQSGIVYIDEIDKIAKHETASASNRVGGEGVQQSLLKMMEGTVVTVPIQGSKNGNNETVEIDTSNILFICGGAFVGLKDVARKNKSRQTIGFGCQFASNEMDKSDVITTEDLIDFGMIPEFLGRLPIVVSLDALTLDDMVRILTEPKNAIIKQFQQMFLMDDIQLDFEQSAIERIAEIAIERNVGARGLRSILESIMTPITYQISDNSDIHSILITKDIVNQATESTSVFDFCQSIA